MAKKKHRGEPPPKAEPKFGGFHPLAAGLGGIKAKLEAEEKEKAKAPPKAGSPPPPKTKPQAARSYERPSNAALDDEHAFHRMMSGVVPLDDRGHRVPVGTTARGVPANKTKPADIKLKAQEEAVAVLDHLHQLVDGGVRFEVTDDGKRVEGRRLDVPPTLLRELRRGVLPIDGRLDLHGLGAEAAREKVVEFLRAKRAVGERCVLVIHGKGEHSVSPGGVLRGEIAAWLSQGRAREHVAAFATARDDDGGEGAVYVALRR